MRLAGRLVLASALAASLAACAKVNARMPAPVVALEMPPPPARLLVPVELAEPVAEAAPPPDPPAPAVPATRTRESSTTARNTNERPAQPTAPAAAVPEPSPSAPVLQTQPDVSKVEERTIRALAAAERDLGRLRQDQLGANAKAQFDQAVGYIRNSKEAIRIKNFMYAEQLANKAAAVAALLANP